MRAGASGDRLRDLCGMRCWRNRQLATNIIDVTTTASGKSQSLSIDFPFRPFSRQASFSRPCSADALNESVRHLDAAGLVQELELAVVLRARTRLARDVTAP